MNKFAKEYKTKCCRAALKAGARSNANWTELRCAKCGDTRPAVILHNLNDVVKIAA
jgi:hypothetical protein